MAHVTDVVARRSISFTKRDLVELNGLCSAFDENTTIVVRKAINLLYFVTFQKDIPSIQEKIEEIKNESHRV